VKIDAWWGTPEWHAYERAYGDVPGTRTRVLQNGRWSTRVVDLSPEERVLWRGVRRSYHAIINRLGREYRPGAEAGPQDMCTRSIVCRPTFGAGVPLLWAAQRVHQIDAGRVTRPDETWELMGAWVNRGHGLLAMANDYHDQHREHSCVGYVYFDVWDGWAYYHSAATLRRDVNIGLVWWAMLALKACGVRWCELGWQGQAADAKGLQLEFFRRGFGGVDVALDAELEE